MTTFANILLPYKATLTDIGGRTSTCLLVGHNSSHSTKQRNLRLKYSGNMLGSNYPYNSSVCSSTPPFKGSIT